MNVSDQVARSTWHIGDEILVNTSDYGVPGDTWCPITRFSLGDAARYPIKVEIPGRGEGQYRAAEVLDHRPAHHQ